MRIQDPGRPPLTERSPDLIDEILVDLEMHSLAGVLGVEEVCRDGVVPSAGNRPSSWSQLVQPCRPAVEVSTGLCQADAWQFER